MTWHDLNDDLAQWALVDAEAAVGGHGGPYPAVTVACRVAALWQPCPDCAGKGRGFHSHRPVEACSACEAMLRAYERTNPPPCSRCGGTGIRPTDEAIAMVEDRTAERVMANLRIYLFGKE